MNHERMKTWAFKNAIDTAKGFLERDGGLEPMFLGYTEDSTIVMPGTFRNDREKAHFLDVIRLVYAYYEVDYYIVVSEAWMSTADPKVKRIDGEPVLTVPPRDDPNRKEVVMFMCVSRKGVESRVFDMLRDKKGDYKGLKEAEGMGGANMSGTFTELLPPRGKMPDHIKKHVEEILERLNIKAERIDPEKEST